ncbi:MAG: SPOR domain-containing protein [Bacteroidales bacterium]|nr:SPOR domain-containing protein [Bacteroidales bacterium]
MSETKQIAKGISPLPLRTKVTGAFAVLAILFSAHLFAQKNIPDDFCISHQEQQLFERLNILLEAYGKKPLQASPSLYYVAKLHVGDLAQNHPDTSVCNLSSWSGNGDWTACCYTPYLPNQDCMWDKPKELTRYPYRGYELVSYFEDEFNVDSVISLWGNSRQVLDMLLTDGNFAKKKWVCMGVGMNSNYVSVWFGQREDRAKKLVPCDTSDFQAAVPTSTSQSGEVPVYYLIVGSLTEMRDAKEYLKRLKKNGFEQAGILSGNQNHRIYISRYNNLKEAMFAKKQLPFSYRGAWVLKQ